MNPRKHPIFCRIVSVETLKLRSRAETVLKGEARSFSLFIKKIPNCYLKIIIFN